MDILHEHPSDRGIGVKKILVKWTLGTESQLRCNPISLAI